MLTTEKLQLHIHVNILFHFLCLFLTKGTVQKKKKNVGIFPKGGWGPPNLGSISHFFLFIFKHGLNYPEMQRNFVHPLVTHPPQVGTPKFGGKVPLKGVGTPEFFQKKGEKKIS